MFGNTQVVDARPYVAVVKNRNEVISGEPGRLLDEYRLQMVRMAGSSLGFLGQR